jgi:hypothetical protein
VNGLDDFYARLSILLDGFSIDDAENVIRSCFAYVSTLLHGMSTELIVVVVLAFLLRGFIFKAVISVVLIVIAVDLFELLRVS